MKDSIGRLVVDVECDHSGDVCDSYVTAAVYADDLTDVPEHELEYLTENYPEYLSESHLDYSIGRAEDCYEGDR